MAPTPRLLLANADAALYRAKTEGRGAIRFFDAEMDIRLRERRALRRELQSALDHNELSLNYQPQALVGGEIVGFEALVRWQSPSRGLVPSTTFIPLAEESGLIIPIGEWILREACREAVSWPRPLQIAVNLSPVQFRHGDLPALVHSVLLETGRNAMLYAVLFEDDPDASLDVRDRHMAAHLAFLERNAQRIKAAGPLRTMAEEAAGGLWLVEADAAGVVESLVKEDPFWSTGLRRSVRILSWSQVFADGRRLIIFG